MELVREKTSWTIHGTCPGETFVDNRYMELVRENFVDGRWNLFGRELCGGYMELVWEKTLWRIACNLIRREFCNCGNI